MPGCTDVTYVKVYFIIPIETPYNAWNIIKALLAKVDSFRITVSFPLVIKSIHLNTHGLLQGHMSLRYMYTNQVCYQYMSNKQNINII